MSRERAKVEERRDVESDEEEEDIVFTRVKNYKKTKDRVAVLQVEDAAETDLLKKLEEEGMPDVPQRMSTNTQLFVFMMNQNLVIK